MMSKKENCNGLPCGCAIETRELQESLDNLIEATRIIRRMKITEHYHTLKESINEAVTVLPKKITKAEQECHLKLTDLKEVTQTSLPPQVSKENWIAVSMLLDNAMELFTSDLYGQCHEQWKQRQSK